jgi:soluble lytic murein transglycosylase-like protein
VTHIRRPAPSLLYALTALILGLCGAGSAGAELVVLTDGNVMKVKTFEAVGEQAHLTFLFGGRMTLPITRVERVVDDVASLIPLEFDESQPVPEGRYGALIYETARKHSVNPQIVAAMIRQESAGNPRALSHKGARGLMQLMPATAHRFGVRKERLYEPEHNLEAGVRYLTWLIDHFQGDLAKVLAAYNAGENAVIRYGGIPPYKETRNYVKRIFGNLGLSVAGLPL